MLTAAELKLVDELFEMSSGWVMDFKNPTFASFFTEEVGIDIFDDAYTEFGTSKGKRLRAFLVRGQAKAIVKALDGLWKYREVYLAGAEDKVPHGLQNLNRLIVRLGGSPISSDEGPAHQSRPAPKVGPNTSELAALDHDFLELVKMDEDRQRRGYAFERFLNKWFGAWGLDPRRPFKITGEQIDGSFLHGNAVYLMEAKWRDAWTIASELRSFQGLVEERIDGTRGLFISYAGFSLDAVEAFQARRVLLMDGPDIHEALRRHISLDEIIARKHRIAAEERRPSVSVRELFP